MKNILFLDGVSPYKYDFNIIKTKGIGASEGYLLYLAEQLVQENNNVVISQKHYQVGEENTQKGVVFLPFNTELIKEYGEYDTIIIQRHPYLIHEVKRIFPKSKIIVWLHDFFEGSVYAQMNKEELKEFFTLATFVCVSNWHRNNFYINLKLRGIKYSEINITYNHFFIPEPEIKNKLPYDKNKLCFFSAGHKGFDFTLKTFKQLHQINPDFRLYIANPTYDQSYKVEQSENSPVINLDNLTRNDVCNHLQSSLCALHLNKIYPETFGCVNAEANLMGTPVLCYDLGATKEVLDFPYYNKQFIKSNEYRHDPDNILTIIETILYWHEVHRPIISLNNNIDKRKILKRWIEIIS